MNGPGEQGLPGAGLSQDEDRQLGTGRDPRPARGELAIGSSSLTKSSRVWCHSRWRSPLTPGSFIEQGAPRSFLRKARIGSKA